MSRDLAALEVDVHRWVETFARLHRRKRFQRETWFALGSFHGSLETLEALGHPEVEERLRAAAQAEAEPDEVELALGALARWLGQPAPSRAGRED